MIGISTFIWNKESLDSALETPVQQILIEHPLYSLRTPQPITSEEDFSQLTDWVHSIKLKNPACKIVFNLDILAHNDDLPRIAKLIHYLDDIGVHCVRVQEIGIASYIRKINSAIEIQLAPEIGLNNEYALNFLNRSLSEGIDYFTAPSELPYLDVKRIADGTNICTEVYAYGPILLQYSARKVLSGAGVKHKEIQVLEEKRRENGNFTLIENLHGTFMFHTHFKNLLGCIPQIGESGASSILIDGRMQKIEDFRKILYVFHQALQLFNDSPEAFKIDEKWNETLNKLALRPYTIGFFRENTTDTLVNEKRKEEEVPLTFVGTVLDSIKENIIAIETKSAFKKGDTLLIMNPGGKEIKVHVNSVMNYNLREINTAAINHINVIGWHKGVITKAQVYKI